MPLGGATMLHDFIATANHLIFFVSPVRVDVPRDAARPRHVRAAVPLASELGTEVIVMPIDRDPTEVIRFSTDAFYQWHFANAFERGGELVIDYVRYPSFDTFYEIGGYRGGGHGRRARRAVITARR